MAADPPLVPLREHAVPFDSSTPIRSLADARVVGLGEATHGTRECFEFKRRLIQRLVQEHGFRTVAFEADAAAATALDAYVRHGRDTVVDAPADAESALARLAMWQWRTESVRELLEWLREFNAGRATGDRVRIRGVDLSTPAAPAEPLREYVERVDPGVLESDAFRTVSEATVPDDEEERERELDAVAAAASTLGDRLESAPESDGTASRARRTARYLCRAVEQTCEWAKVRHQQPGPHPEGMATRDRFMAENALSAPERDPGSGVALWAHDGHVQRGTFDDGTPWADTTTAGERLARRLGDDYRPVGFDFARGSFRAVGADSGQVETFGVGEPLGESATAAFASVAEGPSLIDLRAAAADAELERCLTGERLTRYVGSVFDPDGGAAESYARTDLSASFDWLLFLPESTPTRPVAPDRGQNP